jgi:two-component system chemotaxis sensor kinase CheA
MDDLTREFLIESQEGLDRMERCLTELESKPSDTGLLAEIFRTVHTIKGTVGFLGFKRLEKLAHSGENLLGLLREGKLAADGQVITGLLQLQDGLRAILKLIEGEGNEGEDTDAVLIDRLVELQAPAMAGQGGRGRSGHPTATVILDQAFAGQAGPAVVDPAPTAATPGPGQVGASPTRTDVQGEEDRYRDEKNQGEENQDRQDSDRKDKGPGRDASKLKSVSAGTAAESTLRVDVTLLNRMMNLVGELVLPPRKDSGDASGDMQRARGGRTVWSSDHAHLGDCGQGQATAGATGAGIYWRHGALSRRCADNGEPALSAGSAAEGWAPGHPGAGELRRVAWTAGGFGGRGADGFVFGV